MIDCVDEIMERFRPRDVFCTTITTWPEVLLHVFRSNRPLEVRPECIAWSDTWKYPNHIEPGKLLHQVQRLLANGYHSGRRQDGKSTTLLIFALNDAVLSNRSSVLLRYNSYTIAMWSLIQFADMLDNMGLLFNASKSRRVVEVYVRRPLVNDIQYWTKHTFKFTSAHNTYDLKGMKFDAIYHDDNNSINIGQV